MRRTLITLAVVVTAVTAVTATAVAQQEEPEGATLSVEPSTKPSGREARPAWDGASGDLVGRIMVSFNTNKQDSKIDRMRVRADGCRVRRGASITVRDRDGTVARVVGNQGARIYEDRPYVAVRGTGRYGAIRFFVLRKGDGGLDQYSRVTRSTRIICSQQN